MPFTKGQSGNATGRVRGQPNRLTGQVRKVVNANGGKIIADIVKDALAGDIAARTLFVRYSCPSSRV
jgi:hypothetical protein